ncbi:hypothetical protein CL656_06145 [bacterium]|nr:hypothetical protein [bacterium]|tara:strand:- start:1309 stop:1542 length:234 start_codon:yes stop_codon:yes gene_type:complete
MKQILKSVFLPIFGGLTGSLFYVAIEDIINYVKNGPNKYKLKFHWKRFMNIGMGIGIVSGFKMSNECPLIKNETKND